MALSLVTDRLRIQPLDAADVRAFVAYRREPEVARFQSWEPTYDERDAARLLAQQPTGDLPEPDRWLQLGIRDATTGALLGDVAVHTLADQPDTYEIGVTIAPAAQGTGVASEALRALLGHLVVAAGAHRVVAWCDARNASVARLLTRIGMRHEARLVEADRFKGEWATLDGYAVLARELEPPHDS